jgi:hypothetical protein
MLSSKEQIFQAVNLSANTAADRVNDLADVACSCQLKEKRKRFLTYLLAPDDEYRRYLYCPACCFCSRNP